MNRKKEKTGRKKKVIVAVAAAAGVIALCVLGAILYINSGYRTAQGTFGYKLTFNTRKYEFVTSSNSIDIFQIKDLGAAENDCYIYVGNYDPEQDLQETLEIVNKTDGTDLTLMNTVVGSESYPASFVGFIPEGGGYAYIYFVDYNGHNYVISTLTDKKHQSEIEEMLASFTIVE